MGAHEDDDTRAQPVGPGGSLLPIVFVVVLAFCVRALGYSDVFYEEGEVALRYADASYHARRVFYGVANFPHVLSFDPYLDYPDGARVPWPPLYDWLLSCVGWSMGGSTPVVNAILAWASPVLGALAVVPIFAATRAIASRGTAYGAALIYSVLPITVKYARVGNPDHHALLVLLAASYLATSMWLHAERGPSRLKLNAGLLVVRVGLTLSWSGSLLYLGLGEGALLLAALVRGDDRSLRDQALGSLATVLIVVPFIAFGQDLAPDAKFSASALSWLHVLFWCGAALLSFLLVAAESRWPARTHLARISRAVGFALALSGLFLLAPLVREGLVPAMSYLAEDSGFEGNIEQLALYPWLRGTARVVGMSEFSLYAGYAYLIPFALVAVLLVARDPERRPAALVLACWILGLAPLAIAQVRWGNDFAPAASIGFAIFLTQLTTALMSRLPANPKLSSIVAALLGVGLFVPIVPDLYGRLIRDVSGLESRNTPADMSPNLALVRFGRRVRDSTPRTSGFASPGERPEYGIMAKPGYGHILHYVAQRATPADNFGPQFNTDRHASVREFFLTRSEERAVAIARETHSRYVMTDHRIAKRRGVAASLHANNGSARRGALALGHFRLVSVAQPGTPAILGGGGSGVPYKLFEVVEGAVLEVAGEAGAKVLAVLELRNAWQGKFVWRGGATVGEDGIARLRVPYSTKGATQQTDVRPIGSYHVRVGDREWKTDVDEQAVRDAIVIRVVGEGSRALRE